MTFKQFIDKHWSSIGMIEEKYHDIVRRHIDFKFLDDEPTTFVMIGNEERDDNTVIDGKQEITIDGNNINVNDTDNNKLVLTFFKLEQIQLNKI